MTTISNDWPATIAEPEATPEVLDEIRKRFYRAGTSTSPVGNLESWIASANDVPELLAEITRLRAELEPTAKARAKLAAIRALCETPGINVMGADIIAIINPEETP
jgi:hypothetical protein